jgi:hypothetical protein
MECEKCERPVSMDTPLSGYSFITGKLLTDEVIWNCNPSKQDEIEVELFAFYGKNPFGG